MHFEVLHFDADQSEVLEAKVGDEVFSGATVNWKGYMRPDRIWMFERLVQVLELWTEPRGGQWRVTGQADDEGHNVRYGLEHLQASGWATLPALDTLPQQVQAEVMGIFDEVLASVNAHLLIY